MNMMKIMKQLSLVAAITTLSGCAVVAGPVSNGFIVTNLKGPGHATTHVDAPKEGVGCATNVLGLFATGDASIETAKRSARITEVASVDYQSNSFLGLYARFCVLVRGK